MAQRLTVLIPAFNEAESLADTIRSLREQTRIPDEIVVIDDCSTDQTGDVARALGVTVLVPPKNTGSKAGAQNFALTQVTTEYTMAIDADTTLATDAIEKLMAALDNPKIMAACGFVVPRHVRSLWERGRYAEYLLVFSWYKPIQDYYEKPLISSGCFSLYRTRALKEHGGWSTRTLAEDMDLTWGFYKNGYGVKFVPEAVCYPIEPHDYHFMSKQLRRWSHGFVQNVMTHWRNILMIPYLRTFVAVAAWDAVVASVASLILIPLLAVIFREPLILLAYIIDLPVVLVPILLKAHERKEFWRALGSMPSFLVLRTVNGFFMLEAVFSELVLRKSFRVYEKGH